MKKLLHIIATPRQEESRTLKISNAFIKHLKEKNMPYTIDELNLYNAKLPELTIKRIDGKYLLLGGKELKGEYKSAWLEIENLIKGFSSNDAYLLSAPMWNFGIPYILKQYIDIIVQPGYLFRYTEKGPEGLLKDKKMAIITSRGGDYSQNSPFRIYDHQEPYLKTVFGFIGIRDIVFINAEPMDALGPEIEKQKIDEAIFRAKKIAETF